MNLDKAKFLEKAPIYYALGIAVGISTSGRAKSIQEISIALGDVYSDLFSIVGLRNAAVKLLVDEGAILELSDDFGPTVYKISDNFSDWWGSTASQKFLLFQKFQDMGNKKDWLVSALLSVNETYGELGIGAEDFGILESEWEPIPLDRGDPALIEATQRVDEAIEAIQADNGYAVHEPGEREYVLRGLRAFSNELKTQTEVYWLQIKTLAIEPLGRVIKRFGDAAVGVAASAARQAIFDWLKTNFGKLIDKIFS